MVYMIVQQPARTSFVYDGSAQMHCLFLHIDGKAHYLT